MTSNQSTHKCQQITYRCREIIRPTASISWPKIGGQNYRLLSQEGTLQTNIPHRLPTKVMVSQN